jgi:hypothetical protein
MNFDDKSLPPEPDSSNLVPPSDGAKPFDPFSPENVRINPSYLLQGAVKKHRIYIPVRRPNKQDFVRVHPDPKFQIAAALIELEEERSMPYWILPSLLPELDPSNYRFFNLALAVTRLGNPFLWKVAMPGPDNRPNPWHTSMLDAIEFCKQKWARVVPVMQNKCYELREPMANFPAPEWPNDIPDIYAALRLGFKGFVIDSLDHEILKRLHGEL